MLRDGEFFLVELPISTRQLGQCGLGLFQRRGMGQGSNREAAKGEDRGSAPGDRAGRRTQKGRDTYRASGSGVHQAGDMGTAQRKEGRGRSTQSGTVGPTPLSEPIGSRDTSDRYRDPQTQQAASRY